MAYVFFFPVEEKKWRKRNQLRVKEKPATFSTKNRIPKRMLRKKVEHSDNIEKYGFGGSRQQGPDVQETLLKIRSWKHFEMAMSTWDVQEKKRS